MGQSLERFIDVFGECPAAMRATGQLHLSEAHRFPEGVGANLRFADQGKATLSQVRSSQGRQRARTRRDQAIRESAP